MQEPRKLQDYLIERPEPKGIDVLCGLKHFAIITYAVPAARFEGLFPSRFQLDTVDVDGQEMGLMSVVPFVDVDFTSAVFPFPKFTMGQTNYRIYIIDTETGERCVWFLGTYPGFMSILPQSLWISMARGEVRFAVSSMRKRPVRAIPYETSRLGLASVCWRSQNPPLRFQFPTLSRSGL
ncbi:MAG: DUF2071 domain-containing protein [Pseudomonadales bacterium]